MSQEEEIRLISVFFYLSLLQEEMAVYATSKAWCVLNSKRSKKKPETRGNPSLMVHSMNQVLNSLKNTERFLGFLKSFRGPGWVFPGNFDLELWKDFQQIAKRDEFAVVLWSKVLKLRDDDIARGLSVSEGTVRHRLGRGLRVLGSCLHSEGVIHGK